MPSDSAVGRLADKWKEWVLSDDFAPLSDHQVRHFFDLVASDPEAMNELCGEREAVLRERLQALVSAVIPPGTVPGHPDVELVPVEGVEDVQFKSALAQIERLMSMKVVAHELFFKDGFRLGVAKHAEEYLADPDYTCVPLYAISRGARQP